MSNNNNKRSKVTQGAEPQATGNDAGSRFEKVFYRYLAWFPILVLPMMVWEMMGTGQYGVGSIVALIHAVLVFRFVQVINLPGLFKRRRPTDA
ncbi:MAG: hypothetical protein LRY66_05165 [Saccharospirillaceae bacterium]|nr:hypothetical protein [Saccharospirillaceae bacterium]MCD8530747.1 hypothetical protein [Saccharospirillaceae bacterium]